jgi:hypothetical protein
MGGMRIVAGVVFFDGVNFMLILPPDVRQFVSMADGGAKLNF